MDPIILKKYDKAGGYAKLQGYNEKADIWSLGAICYEMLTGETLFNVESLQQLMEKVEEGNYNIPLYVVFSKEIISFLYAMLQYDGEKRYSAEQLSNHSFLIKNVKDFTKVDFNTISKKIKNGAFEINIKNNDTVGKIFGEKIQDKYTLISGIKMIPMNIKDFSKPKQRLKEACASPMRNRKKKNIVSAKINNEKKVYEGIKKSIMDIGEYENEKNKIQITEKVEDIYKPNEKDRWGQYINGLLDEYKSAKYYFIKNKLNIQEQDTNNKILEILNIQNEYRKGNLNYLSNLPKPISPEYIYGCSTLERNQKYKKLIEFFIKDRNKLITKLQSYKKFAITKHLKEEYEKDKKKLFNLNIVIQNIQQNLKNEWAPSPDYSINNQNYRTEKISYDNCDFKLKIETKKNDNKNEDIIFSIYLIINNKKTVKYIQLKNENNFCDECIHTIKYNEWKNVDNNVEDFILGFENENNVGYNTYRNIVSLMDVKKGKSISFNIKLPTKNKNVAKILFIITPIIPEGEKKWTIETKEYLILKKIFPPFKGKSNLTSNPPCLS